MRREGVSFRTAVERLASSVRSRVTPPRASAAPDPDREPSAVVAPSAADAVLLTQVVEYYHLRLKETPRALEYLEGRGLRHPELVERFRLGFADRTLGKGLPGTPQSRTREEVRGTLQRLGVLRSSGHEHFRGSVVIPVFGRGGEVTELYGRTLRTPRRGNAGAPLPAGPAPRVWNVEALGATEELSCASRSSTR